LALNYAGFGLKPLKLVGNPDSLTLCGACPLTSPTRHITPRLTAMRHPAMRHPGCLFLEIRGAGQDYHQNLTVSSVPHVPPFGRIL